MPLNERLSGSPSSVSRTVRGGSTTESFSAVTQRLATAERELRIQFTRIAQLQAQLDLLIAALRHWPDGVDVRGASAPGTAFISAAGSPR